MVKKNPLSNPYKAIGTEKLFEMIDRFYYYVERDDRINYLFPGDFKETAFKQKLFQVQFLGGPNLYIQEYGHPMMKARHMPFVITPYAKEAWLENMYQAMLDVDIPEELREFLFQRYTMTANHMVNTPD